VPAISIFASRWTLLHQISGSHQRLARRAFVDLYPGEYSRGYSPRVLTNGRSYPLTYQSPTFSSVNNNGTVLNISYADGSGKFILSHLVSTRSLHICRGKLHRGLSPEKLCHGQTFQSWVRPSVSIIITRHSRLKCLLFRVSHAIHCPTYR
jgi:hypothetical protein